MSADPYSFYRCVTSELEIDFAVHDANTDRFSEKIRNGWKLTAHARLAMNLMRGRSHFIDIGANIGTFSIPVSMSTGARCLDVEALPSNIPLLEANLERNGVDNHEIAHVAAMERAGSVFIKGTTAFGTVNADGEGVEVPGVRLDDIVMGTEFEHAALVKIDIEGSELRALMGLEQFFANSGPDHVIFEGNGAHCAAQGYMPRDLIRFFHDRGYTVYLVGGSRLSKRTPDDF
ncbi:MAG: FkbM family methyltransferase [Acidimicrobiaceae bacterium]|nr:FkbM family methyltransferase [Acidimicrobiaceae bacterium]